jgi:hypothetical protein
MQNPLECSPLTPNRQPWSKGKLVGVLRGFPLHVSSAAASRIQRDPARCRRSARGKPMRSTEEHALNKPVGTDHGDGE